MGVIYSDIFVVISVGVGLEYKVVINVIGVYIVMSSGGFNFI